LNFNQEAVSRQAEQRPAAASEPESALLLSLFPSVKFSGQRQVFGPEITFGVFCVFRGKQKSCQCHPRLCALRFALRTLRAVLRYLRLLLCNR
jgi:hypothetical protein